MHMPWRMLLRAVRAEVRAPENGITHPHRKVGQGVIIVCVLKELDTQEDFPNRAIIPACNSTGAAGLDCFLSMTISVRPRNLLKHVEMLARFA